MKIVTTFVKDNTNTKNMIIEFEHEIEQLDLLLDVEVTFEKYHYRGDYDMPNQVGVEDVEIQLFIGKLNVTELIKSQYPHYFDKIEDKAEIKALDSF